MDIWIIIVLFFAAVVILIAVSIMFDRRRTEAIKALAYSLGFQYQPEPKPCLPSQIWQFDLFSKGRSRHLKNLIQGRIDGVKVSVGDYRYTIGGGKSKHTYSQTFVVIESDDLHLPSFRLVPENVFHKLGNIFGYHDIDFDTYPDFSSRYLLRGSDEASIRKVFHDGVLKFYQDQVRVSTEGFGSVLIYYRTHQTLPPEQWQVFMNEALTAYQHLATEGYF